MSEPVTQDEVRLPTDLAAFVVRAAVRGCLDAALTESPARIDDPALDHALCRLVERYLRDT